jgi:hypothetical protein
MLKRRISRSAAPLRANWLLVACVLFVAICVWRLFQFKGADPFADYGLLVSFVLTLVVIGQTQVESRRNKERDRRLESLERARNLPELRAFSGEMLTHGAPGIPGGANHWLATSVMRQDVGFRNIGTGTARKIGAVLFGCDSYVKPGVEPPTRTNELDWVFWANLTESTCSPDSGISMPLERCKGDQSISRNLRIGSEALYAPEDPDPKDLEHRLATYYSGRLTVTWRDTNDQRYASKFDYDFADRRWRPVVENEIVDRDLWDLLGGDR